MEIRGTGVRCILDMEWADFDGVGEDRGGIKDGGRVSTLQKWDMGAFAEMGT